MCVYQRIQVSMRNRSIDRLMTSVAMTIFKIFPYLEFTKDGIMVSISMYVAILPLIHAHRSIVTLAYLHLSSDHLVRVYSH